MVDICAEVANALHWSLAVPRHKVMAEANGGVVTLRGIVDWAYQKSYAGAIARRAPGVVDVTNNIAIRSYLEFSLSSFQP